MDQYMSCIRDILAIAKSCAPDDFCRVSYIVNNFPQYDEQYIYPICDDLYEYGYIKAVIKRHTPNPSIIVRITGITPNGILLLNSLSKKNILKKVFEYSADVSSVVALLYQVITSVK